MDGGSRSGVEVDLGSGPGGVDVLSPSSFLGLARLDST